MLSFRSSLVTFVPTLFLAHLATGTPAEFGTVDVIQNDGGNESSSVTLTRSTGSSPGATITGGNRGDYNVSFGRANDPAEGVLISSPAQISRDDSALGGPAATFHQATTAVTISGSRYYIPVFRSPEGDEANLNAAFVYLPYDTWLGGVAGNVENGSNISTLTASPGLVLGTHFIDPVATTGEYTVKLSPLVANASQNGILLVAGAKNEDNFALSEANSDGSFTVYCHDNGTNGSECENDPVAFAYIPVSAVGQNRLIALGRVNGNASTDVAGGTFTVTKGETGRWYLTIPGQSGGTGTLVVSPAGGESNNADNIVSHEWDEHNGRWIIESRDLPGASLQNMSSNTEDAFSFAFFAVNATNGTPPTASLRTPSTGASFTAGTPVTLGATATDDGTISRVRFYDGETVIADDRGAPYEYVWQNPPLGHHLIEARATDNLGFVTRSNSSAIWINPPAGINGLFFDGYDDYATFGDQPSHRLTKFTLECWFRREPGGTAANSGGTSAIPLIARGRGDSTGANFFLGIDPDTGRLAADFKAAETGTNHPLAGKTAIPAGVWQHAAATFDGTTWNLYLNGNLEATGDTGGEAPAAITGLQTSLGTAINAAGTPAGNFLGFMDEVRIWNRARTQQEIREFMNAEIPFAAGLASRHAMDEAAGTEILNKSGGAITGTLVKGVFRTTGAPFDLNVPPGVTPSYPANEQTGISRNPALQVSLVDPDDSSIKVRYFGRSTSDGPLSDFTVVALPDTQWYSENAGGNLAAIFSAQTDWVVAQRSALKISAVLHLGDITQNGDNPSTSATQWANASNAMYRLENPSTTLLNHGIPYSMAVGNHDQTPIGNADGTTTGYNTYFGVHPTTKLNHFRGKSYYGGTSIPSSADNNYILFSAGGIEFIVITLEFDNTPDDEDLLWADALLKAHPTRCGIVTSHWTVNTGNPASFSVQGSAIYQALKNNPNLIMLHGGHIAGEGRRSDTYQGRTVHSLLADYQSRANGGNGWLRIMKFRPELNRIDIQTYSPTLDRYETDGDSQFSINVDLAGRGKPFVELGSVDAAPGPASLVWPGLELGTRYEWYAEADDGQSVTRSQIHQFTTSGSQLPPAAAFTFPANGDSFSRGAPITLQVAATDTDGTIASVRYFSGTTQLGETTASPHSFVWNNPPEGVHTLIAKALDNDGLEGVSTPIEIRVNASASVTIQATDASAGEYGADQTLGFTFSRTGATTADLLVNYTLGGTATPGADFAALPGSLTIPGGQSTALLPVQVLPDDLPEGPETLIVQLATGTGYVAGSPPSAMATIQDRPFSAWLRTNGMTSGDGDHNQNGVPDIIDYYMGRTSDASTHSRTLKALPGPDGSYKAAFPRAKGAVDVAASIEWSADMKSWYASGESDGTRTATISTVVTSPAGEDPELLEATATISAGAAPRTFFLRLAVQP